MQVRLLPEPLHGRHHDVANDADVTIVDGHRYIAHRYRTFWHFWNSRDPWFDGVDFVHESLDEASAARTIVSALSGTRLG